MHLNEDGIFRNFFTNISLLDFLNSFTDKNPYIMVNILNTYNIFETILHEWKMLIIFNLSNRLVIKTLTHHEQALLYDYLSSDPV